MTRQIKILIFKIVGRSLGIGFNFKEQQERANFDADLCQIQNSRGACSKDPFLPEYSQILNLSRDSDSAAVKTKQESACSSSSPTS